MTMNKLIFITGSVRSGKSSLAVTKAVALGQPVVFLATCKPLDSEMQDRVRRHQSDRPDSWQTVEEDIEIASVIARAENDSVVILDCMTLWVTNLMMAQLQENEIFARLEKLIDVLMLRNCTVIMVSNEVGWGIVPDNKLARDFRDIIGRLHQRLADVSDELFLTVCGIPLQIK